VVVAPRRRIIYCAIDNPIYAQMARKSLESVYKFSNNDFDAEIIENYTGQNHYYEYRNREIKTSLFNPSFKQTLFLDCDILAVNNIDAIWNFKGICLVRNDRPLIADCWHISEAEKRYTIDLYGNLPHCNSGVILFDNSSVSEQFFSEWYKQWNIFKKHDQLALSRALAVTRIPVTELPKRYNCYWKDIEPDTVFQHFSGDGKKHFLRKI
jgi:Glycosyl transferase family 8